MKTTSIGVIGCGYWGPNLIRNFAELDSARLAWICDRDARRLEQIGRRYPQARATTNPDDLFNDSSLDAVCIATPVATHHDFAARLLHAGKHVLLEKPFTRTVREAETLVELADRERLTLMVDHTFVYTGAVRRIKEIVAAGELGDLLYFDSVRINLGIFQPDVNVVWDLAPHDLSIMDAVVGCAPVALTATGSCHVEQGRENIAYVQLRFPDAFIANFHFNWLSPVKIRRTLIAGSRRMIVYDDIEPTEKVRVYDSGVDARRRDLGAGDDADKEAAYRTLVSYRTGDVWVPKLDQTEALRHVALEFLDAIRERRPPMTDGHAGLHSVCLLEAAQASINAGGKLIKLR